MKILFENIRIPEEYGFADEHIFLLTDGELFMETNREEVFSDLIEWVGGLK